MWNQKFTKELCEEVTDLKSTQVEADTHMLLHAQHAAKAGYKSGVVTAEDTNVLIICLGLQKAIPVPLYQKCGTKNQTHSIDISKLVQSVGGSVCEALIGLHAFTGCNSVSAFGGRGKMTAFKEVR